jgi:hypothetical protein
MLAATSELDFPGGRVATKAAAKKRRRMVNSTLMIERERVIQSSPQKTFID